VGCTSCAIHNSFYDMKNQINKFSEGDINQSDARKEWYRQQVDGETQEWLDRDARVFLHQAMSTPCLDVVSSSQGSSFSNLRGKSYLDFHGNNVHQIGYGNPFVIERVKAQLEQLAFSPRRYTNAVAVEFAEKLTSLLPSSLTRVLFAPGGTSAIGMALKLARYVTGRHKVVSYWDSFHGASLDAISVGGEAVFRERMGALMPGTIQIPPPMNSGGFFQNEMQAADYFEYVVEKEGEIGVFLAETIRNTDVQIPSEAYWKRIREICIKHGILLILDEIPIALGRTGTLFAFEHFGIEPDILCLGKGLGGGLVPFAAMVCREEFNVAQSVSLGHYTHEKSPLGCAAAMATFEFIEQFQILKKVKDDEIWMQQALDKLKEKHPIVYQVRGRGLLWALELRNNSAPATAEAERVMYACLNEGLSFKVSQGHVLQLSPALTITRVELQEAVQILDRALAQINT
jgi:4-aminobutyrate aminotransferase